MLSLSSTLLICKQLRLSDAHAREALALASASGWCRLHLDRTDIDATVHHPCKIRAALIPA